MDAAAISLAAALFGWVGYKSLSGLEYNWNWSFIPHYIVRRTPQGDLAAGLLLQGLFTTIRLSLLASVLATLIGFPMGLFRVSPSLFKRLCGGCYVGFVRNTPPLVLVFIFYFFISSQIVPALGLDSWALSLTGEAPAWIRVLFGPPQRLPGFFSAVVTLALYEGAYIAEIVRGGVGSIDHGQWEASAATGLNRPRQLGYVILPQAARRMLPPLTGQYISTIKDSAIVSVISIQELTFQGMELMAATYRTFEIWITVTAMYFVLTFFCSLAVRRLELTFRRESMGNL